MHDKNNVPRGGRPKSTRKLAGKAIPHKTLVDMSHHTLRAHAKAFELAGGSVGRYSYEIAVDGKSAVILDPQGQVVSSKSIEEWAADGPSIRLAFIGLKAFKEKLDEASRDAGRRFSARYHLNALEGDVAELSVQDQPLGRDELLARAAELKLVESVKNALEKLGADELKKISGWAKLGREVEVDFYQVLQAAEKWQLHDAAAAERERGYRLGILRRPRVKPDTGSASGGADVVRDAAKA